MRRPLTSGRSLAPRCQEVEHRLVEGGGVLLAHHVRGARNGRPRHVADPALHGVSASGRGWRAAFAADQQRRRPDRLHVREGEGRAPLVDLAEQRAGVVECIPRSAPPWPLPGAGPLMASTNRPRRPRHRPAGCARRPSAVARRPTHRAARRCPMGGCSVSSRPRPAPPGPGHAPARGSAGPPGTRRGRRASARAGAPARSPSAPMKAATSSTCWWMVKSSPAPSQRSGQ